MKTFVASLTMRFVDRLSSPARSAARAVGDIKRAQDLAARASAQWSRGLNDLDDKLDRLSKVSLVTEGLGRAGQSMMAPLQAATRQGAAFGRGMTGIGITAQLTDRQLLPLRRSILATATELGALPATVQATYSAVLAEGAYRTEADLARAGRAVARFQRLAETMSDPLSDTEAGGLTAALGGTMGVKAGDLDRNLAMANRSAQQGGVGLGVLGRNMPAQIGSLSGLSFANDVGLADLLTANQIAKRLAGSSDQAANNVTNLFAAMASPETIKNFSEAGVNIEREIKRGVERGISPLETIAAVTQRITGGDQFRIGELFGDRQARDAVMALTQNLDDFRKMSGELKGADVLPAYMADLARATSGPAASFDRYTSSIARASIATGTILAPAVSVAADLLGRVANWMSRASESGNPLARAAVFVAAGLAGVAVAAGAVGTAVMGILGPWFIMKSMFGTMGGAAVAAGFARIAGGIATARNAVIGFNLAMLANPVGLMVAGAVAAVAVVALVVRKYWGPISTFMSGVGQGIAEAFRPLGAVLAPLRPVWTAIAGGLGAAWRRVTRLLAPVKATEDQLKGATSAGQAFGRLLGRALLVPLASALIVGAAVQGVFGLIRRIMSWSPAETMSRLWSPIASVADAVWSRVTAAVGEGLGRVGAALLRFTPLGAIARNWSGITGFLGQVWSLAGEAVGLGIDSVQLSLLRFTPLGPIVRNWSPMVAAVGRVWSGVRGAVGSGIATVGGLIQRWNPAVLGVRAWVALAPAAARAWTAVRGRVGAGASAVLGVLMRFTPLGPIARAWRPVTGFVAGVWTRGRALVANGIAAIGAAIRAWSPLAPFQAAFASVFGWLEGLPRRFGQIGTNIVQGMTNGIRGQRAAVQAASAQAAGGAATAAQRRLGIRSPSRVFAQLGDFAMQGLALGLDRSAGRPIARVAAMAAALASAVPGQVIAAPAFEVGRAAAQVAAPAGAAPVGLRSGPVGPSATSAATTPVPITMPLAPLARTASRLFPTGEFATFSRAISAILSQRPAAIPPAEGPLSVQTPAPAPVRLFGLETASPQQGIEPRPLSPVASPPGPAGGAGPVAQTVIHHHHRYGDQTFHVAGGEKTTRELARELQRLAQSRSRAAMNDGEER